MYTQESLEDLIFLMFYGSVAMLALTAGLYLWLRRSNAIAPGITPPKALRRWTSLFFFTSALSHIWWYVLGVYWLTDDRLVRNITAVLLDRLTLVPLVIALLFSILQDRHRPLWPWILAQVPLVVLAAVGIAKHDIFYGLTLMDYMQMAVVVVFVVYYTYAVIRYGRWLNENYADLEHKEVWQSMLIAVALFIVYELYSTNPGEMTREYLAQVSTIVIIVFLLWRVETLQQLDVKDDEIENEIDAEAVCAEPHEAESGKKLLSIPEHIGPRLARYCEESQLYLQHDLTLPELAKAIGTNRTYLSAYFAQQDITYNTYVNSLRIEHFMRLYREVESPQTTTAQRLAHESGFNSYSTFSTAFKRVKGISVAQWMREN